MGRMYGVALQGLLVGDGAVQKDVGVGARKRGDADMDVGETRDNALQVLKTLLDLRTEIRLFGVGELVLELPENDLLDHFISSFQ